MLKLKLIVVLTLFAFLANAQAFDTLKLGKYPNDPSADKLPNAMKKIDDNFRYMNANGYTSDSDLSDSLSALRLEMNSVRGAIDSLVTKGSTLYLYSKQGTFLISNVIVLSDTNTVFSSSYLDPLGYLPPDGYIKP